jgi:hypothetical protein
LKESPISFLRDSAKKALLRIPTDSSGPFLERIQCHITHVRLYAEDIPDPHAIISAILEGFKSAPTDTHVLRHLFYLTIAFLSEPLLSHALTEADSVALAIHLCEFSLQNQAAFSDALRESAFHLALHANAALFEALLAFIESHSAQLTRRSLPCQIFSDATAALAITGARRSLSAIRALAKRVVGEAAKNDLSAVLCRGLLTEIVAVEQQQLVEAGLWAADAEPAAEPGERGALDGFEVLGLIEGLSRPETKADAWRRLLELDERFPQRRIAETVAKLAPSLKREIEAAERRPLAARNTDGAGVKGSAEFGSRPRTVPRDV